MVYNAYGLVPEQNSKLQAAWYRFFPLETTTHETSNKCYIVWNEKQIMYINFWKLNTYGKNTLEDVEYSRECK